MVRSRTDTFDPESKAVPFDMQLASILSDEGEFSRTSFTAEPPSKDGGFRTIWQCPDGTFITHRHSFATGMGHLHKSKTYSDRFREKLPPWARPLPPFSIWRLCDVALLAGQPLPAFYPQPQSGALTFARIAAIGDGAVRFTGV